jgi:hypothetical protein
MDSLSAIRSLLCDSALRVVHVVEYGGEADSEHPSSNGAEELRHEETADTGEADVLESESSAARGRSDPVADVGGLAVFLASPAVTKQAGLIYLQDLAVDNAPPAWDGLGDELEASSSGGSETDRPPSLAGDGPAGNQFWVGYGTPDPGRWVRIVPDNSDFGHASSDRES